MDRGGPSELQARVLTEDLCAGCGACLGHCPYLKTLGERVAFVHACPRAEGRCFQVCPRTSLDPDRLDRQVFGATRQDALLGSHRGLYFARALDGALATRGQYGGTTTALVLAALSSRTVDAALLTGGRPTELPQPVIARDRASVLEASGTKYTACATLAPLSRHLREGTETLAVVGRPCQVAALRKLEARDDGQLRLGLVIGLFCFWALSPAFYRLIAARPDLKRARKIDIPKDDGVVFSTDNAAVNVRIDEVRPFIRAACQACFDPTSEWADVAVGSTEYDPAWNTLIVRSARGQALVDAACASGALEIKPYPPDRIPLLRTAVRGKKLRVLGAIDEGRPETAYLRVSDQMRDAIRSEGRATA